VELPFTQDQFFELFAFYNLGLGVFPWLVLVCGFALAGMFFWPRPIRNAWIVWFLDVLWLINAVCYHLGAFWQINPAALGFAGLFFIEAIGLGAVAVTARDDLFLPRDKWHFWFSFACTSFSLILYPLWTISDGHEYPAMPLFGVAPCPTTIFTIGILIMMRSPHREWLLVLPLVWCVIGGSAALSLGVTPDVALWVAGVTAFVLLMRDRLPPYQVSFRE
jgi:hypothetical protein